MIKPRNDLVLIERIEKPQTGAIILPDVAKEKSILGKVLAVGPGKRVAGEWRKTGVTWAPDANGIQIASGGEWEWVSGERAAMAYRPGDIVFFNSKWSEFSGSHYSDDQLRDRNLHLVMQADIFLKVANGNRPN
jgi:co-chaperonin GroES (HSP10)